MDYVPITIDISIIEEHIQTKRQSLIKNNKEKSHFIKNLFVLSKVSTQMPFKALMLSNLLFKHSLATSIEFGTNTPKLPISLKWPIVSIL